MSINVGVLLPGRKLRPCRLFQLTHVYKIIRQIFDDACIHFHLFIPSYEAVGAIGYVILYRHRESESYTVTMPAFACVNTAKVAPN